MTTPKIRLVQLQDLPQLLDLCAAHAAYEKCSYDPEGKQERLAKDLFSDAPKLYCLVVEYEGLLIGYATYMAQYATWDAQEYLYMDCLYLTESSRGYGIGVKIIKKLTDEAKRLGCSHIQWQTPDFNTGAIRFYSRIGGTSKSKERFFLTL